MHRFLVAEFEKSPNSALYQRRYSQTSNLERQLFIMSSANLTVTESDDLTLKEYICRLSEGQKELIKDIPQTYDELISIDSNELVEAKRIRPEGRYEILEEEAKRHHTSGGNNGNGGNGKSKAKAKVSVKKPGSESK